ncbi:hypothetical protein E2C01_061200 [Portunus trituberculatus]|uniref:Uncharacterized protein n=1 Tax=Portunus trituberculatus TaxID=210409 RepID=A0A5B7H4K7_PORTR|nr:hypothetical protein [Portunus trituberculatus]
MDVFCISKVLYYTASLSISSDVKSYRSHILLACRGKADKGGLVYRGHYCGLCSWSLAWLGVRQVMCCVCPQRVAVILSHSWLGGLLS